MSIAFSLLLTALTVECFLFFPFIKHSKELILVVKKSTKTVISNNISDHWKERVLLRYAKIIFKETLWIFALLLSALLLIISISLLCDRIIAPSPPIIEVLASPLNWIWMTVAASLYIYLRKILI